MAEDQAVAELPQNLEAERSVLGAMLIEGSTFLRVEPIVRCEDFMADEHRTIYGAMFRLYKRGCEIDTVTLMDELARSGGVERAGGVTYIASLADGVPDVGNVEHYAQMVRRKAGQRRLIQIGQRLVRTAQEDEKPPGELIEEFEGLFRQAKTAETAGQPAAEWPSIASVLRAMPPPGDRLSTGYPALDSCLRGGLVRGRIYMLVGRPHVGKTALAKSLALRCARKHGAAVFGFFFDEGDWPAAVMVAEELGFAREDLEDNFAGIDEQVSLKAAGLRFSLPPPGTLLESLADQVATLDGNNVPIVVVDSIQRVHSRASLEAGNPKDLADANMRALRAMARAPAAPVIIATAKANRSSWASKDPSSRTTALAAGLDSSSIEYDSDFFGFLDGSIDEIIRLKVEKNRLGDGSLPSIPFRFDRRTASFEEVDQEVAAIHAREAEQQVRDAKWSADEARVLDFVRKNPRKSQRTLAALLQIGPSRLGGVLDNLAEKGKASFDGGARGAKLWSATASGDEE